MFPYTRKPPEATEYSECHAGTVASPRELALGCLFSVKFFLSGEPLALVAILTFKVRQKAWRSIIGHENSAVSTPFFQKNLYNIGKTHSASHASSSPPPFLDLLLSPPTPSCFQLWSQRFSQWHLWLSLEYLILVTHRSFTTESLSALLHRWLFYIVLMHLSHYVKEIVHALTKICSFSSTICPKNPLFSNYM